MNRTERDILIDAFFDSAKVLSDADLESIRSRCVHILQRRRLARNNEEPYYEYDYDPCGKSGYRLVGYRNKTTGRIRYK